jgi:hypothetical protein
MNCCKYIERITLYMLNEEVNKADFAKNDHKKRQGFNSRMEVSHNEELNR